MAASAPSCLNICIITNKFSLSGLGLDHGFLWPIARGIAQRGHKVTVLSQHSAPKENSTTQDKVQIFYLPDSHAKMGMATVLKLRFEDLHAQQKFHLVHSLSSIGYPLAREKKRLGVAFAFDIEATQMSQIFSILGMAHETLPGLVRTGLVVAYKFVRTYFGQDRKLLKVADGIFVTSPQQRVALERYYLYPDARTYVVPYGIEIRPLDSKPNEEVARAQLDLPQAAHTVMTVTDMTEIGELRNLLQAFVKVAVKKPNSRLIIVGHGPLRKEIEFEALMLALGNRVIFTGSAPPDRMSQYISVCDVFINLSSRSTGFEPTMLEAMAQRKLVIGSEVSPIATIIQDSKDGYLLRPADVQSLSSLLLAVFNGTIPIREMGERARQKIVNLFDTDKMVEQTIRAYYSILKLK